MSRARALYQFPAAQPGDLALAPGDIVIVLQQMEGGWLEGELRGKRGIFPSNYVEVLPGEAPPVPQRAHRAAAPPTAAMKVPAAQGAPPVAPPVAPDARVAFVPAASRGPRLPAGYVPPPEKELKEALELGPIRILLLGDPFIGKSALIQAMLSPGVFNEAYVPTPAIQLFKGRSQFAGNNCDLEIFDPPGRIETDPSRLATYNVIDVVIICFSLADKVSFDNARARWWEETKFNQQFHNKGILLVGLKSDVADWMSTNDPAARKWMVQMRAEAQGFTKSLKADKYYETSARTLENVDMVLQTALRLKFVVKPTVQSKAKKAGSATKEKLKIMFTEV